MLGVFGSRASGLSFMPLPYTVSLLRISVTTKKHLCQSHWTVSSPCEMKKRQPLSLPPQNQGNLSICLAAASPPNILQLPDPVRIAWIPSLYGHPLYHCLLKIRQIFLPASAASPPTSLRYPTLSDSLGYPFLMDIPSTTSPSKSGKSFLSQPPLLYSILQLPDPVRIAMIPPLYGHPLYHCPLKTGQIFPPASSASPLNIL